MAASLSERSSPFPDHDAVVQAWNLDANQARLLTDFAIGAVERNLNHPILNHPDKHARFLHARDWNVKDALNMFENSLKWRAEVCAEDILGWQPIELIEKHFTGQLLSTRDIDGDPIYLERIGSQDFNGLFSAVGRSTYKRYCLYHREWIGHSLAEQSRLSDKSLWGRQMTIVFDLHGLTMSKCRADNLKTYSQVMRFDQDNYPEMSKVVLILNAPTVFKMVWDIIKHFFDEGTRNKFVFSTSKSQDRLIRRYLPISSIPQCLNGTNPEPVPMPHPITPTAAQEMPAGFSDVLVIRGNPQVQLGTFMVGVGDVVFWDAWTVGTGSCEIGVNFVPTGSSSGEANGERQTDTKDRFASRGADHAGTFKAVHAGHVTIHVGFANPAGMSLRSPTRKVTVRYRVQHHRSSDPMPGRESAGESARAALKARDVAIVGEESEGLTTNGEAHTPGEEQSEMSKQVRRLSSEVDNLRTKMNNNALLVASENASRLDKAISSMTIAQHLRMVIFVVIVGVLAALV